MLERWAKIACENATVGKNGLTTFGSLGCFLAQGITVLLSHSTNISESNQSDFDTLHFVPSGPPFTQVSGTQHSWVMLAVIANIIDVELFVVFIILSGCFVLV